MEWEGSLSLLLIVKGLIFKVETLDFFLLL